MTTIGQILDEFFSPFSKEKLWIMPENDNYTKIVRKWQPVINASNRTKRDLKNNSAKWKASLMTKPTWKPGKTDKPKVNAYRDFVPSPPGTDPATCKEAFVIYVSTKAASSLGPLIPVRIPEIQTRKLYICSIGSFNLYTTVDKIDNSAKKAKMNFWMYNCMSKHSFGKFANDPVFSLCKMEKQYMWWNWSESIDWSSGMIRTIPSATSANKW